MVAVHELAAIPARRTRPDLGPEPRKAVDEIILVRCPCCQGLRGVGRRHVTRDPLECPECRRGRVVLRSAYFAFWLERFTWEEIREMARAVWE